MPVLAPADGHFRPRCHATAGNEKGEPNAQLSIKKEKGSRNHARRGSRSRGRKETAKRQYHQKTAPVLAPLLFGGMQESRERLRAGWSCRRRDRSAAGIGYILPSDHQAIPTGSSFFSLVCAAGPVSAVPIAPKGGP